MSDDVQLPFVPYSSLACFGVAFFSAEDCARGNRGASQAGALHTANAPCALELSLGNDAVPALRLAELARIAFAFIDLHEEKRGTVEEAEDSSQGTEQPAPGPRLDEHGDDK